MTVAIDNEVDQSVRQVRRLKVLMLLIDGIRRVTGENGKQI